jgi:acyl carrier protein
MHDLETEITHKIAELAEIAPERVRRDVPLKELGVDSLMVLEIVAFIERRLHCEIPEGDIPKVRTLSDIMARVGNGNGKH